MTDSDKYLDNLTTGATITEAIWDNVQQSVNASRRFRLMSIFGGGNIYYDEGDKTISVSRVIYITFQSHDENVANGVALDRGISNYIEATNGILLTAVEPFSVVYCVIDADNDNCNITGTVAKCHYSDFDGDTIDMGHVVVLGVTDALHFYPSWNNAGYLEIGDELYGFTDILTDDGYVSSTPTNQTFQLIAGTNILIDADTVNNTITLTAYGGAGTVIFHDELGGLEDDDHPQYFMANGSRDFTGSIYTFSLADTEIRAKQDISFKIDKDQEGGTHYFNILAGDGTNVCRVDNSGNITNATWNATNIADNKLAVSYIKTDGTRLLSGNWQFATGYYLYTDGDVKLKDANLTGDLFFDSESVKISSIKDEDDMTSDSATALATQQSIKKYVDDQVASANELSELTDVNLTSPAEGEVLVYDFSESEWINSTVTAITQVGTIASGLWQGTPVSNNYVAGLNQNCLTTSQPVFAGVEITGTGELKLGGDNYLIQNDGSGDLTFYSDQSGEHFLTYDASDGKLLVEGDFSVGGDITLTGTIDGVDLASFKSDYDLKVNQDVRTTASPTFVGTNLSNNGLMSINGYAGISGKYSTQGFVAGWNAYGDPAVNQLKVRTTHGSGGYSFIDADGNSMRFYSLQASVTAEDIIPTTYIQMDMTEDGIRLGYANSRVNAILDEDNMSSNSATALATQQSIKKYVDDQVASANELSELTDVTLTTPAQYQVLQYNGSYWTDGNYLDQNLRTSDKPVFAGIELSAQAEVYDDVKLRFGDGSNYMQMWYNSADDKVMFQKYYSSTLYSLAEISGSNTWKFYTVEVDNLSLDGNTLTTLSGNLTLDSTGGTVTINDDVSISGTITSGTWQGSAIANSYIAGINQDLLTTSSPTFSSLTINVDLDMTNSSILQANDIQFNDESTADSLTEGVIFKDIGGTTYFRQNIISGELTTLEILSDYATDTKLEVRNKGAGNSNIETDGLLKSVTLQLGATTTVSSILDEDNMASNSATALATQQSIKAYVDTQLSTENELDELNDVLISSLTDNEILQYDSVGSKWLNRTFAEADIATASDLSSHTGDTNNPHSVDKGDLDLDTDDSVTFQDVTLDNGATTVNLSCKAGTSALELNGMLDVLGTIRFSNAAVNANKGVLSATLTAERTYYFPDSDGYLAYCSSAAIRDALVLLTQAEIEILNGATVTTAELNILDGVTANKDELNLLDGITAINDEDDMSSDSDTALCTQQSIKAYVDNETDNLVEITETNAFVDIVRLGSLNKNGYLGYTYAFGVPYHKIEDEISTAQEVYGGAMGLPYTRKSKNGTTQYVNLKRVDFKCYSQWANSTYDTTVRIVIFKEEISGETTRQTIFDATWTFQASDVYTCYFDSSGAYRSPTSASSVSVTTNDLSTNGDKDATFEEFWMHILLTQDYNTSYAQQVHALLTDLKVTYDYA